MLASLTIAECLEGKGRFLDPLMNIVWAICEESSWSYPAHLWQIPDVKAHYIDLFASMTGRQLAEFNLLLGSELDPLVSKRIRDEVDHRIFTPYLDPHGWHWWMYNTQDRKTNNWNAVCNGNIVSAAILLEDDPMRLARIIARVGHSLDDYLDTFDKDGGSTEGPGYWSYGFGNYVLAAHMVNHRTNNRVNFLGRQQIYDIARFPAKTLLSHNLFASFSDCDLHVSLRAPLLAFLARRFDLPQLMALARQQPFETGTMRRVNEILPWRIRDLFWTVESEDQQHFVPNKHDWYSEMQWMISRQNPNNPNALVMAAKGGHNQEMHNQNDVGSFIVHVNGESVISDIGRGRYTKAYFSKKRYEHFVCQSLSHPTPVPNSQQQGAGREFAAELVDYSASDTMDVLCIEMRDAYPPEADLQNLRRTLIFHRDTADGWIELLDDVQFATQPGTLESVLITLGRVEQAVGSVFMYGEKGALQVEYDDLNVAVRVETVPDVDLAEGTVDVQRVIFMLNDRVETGRIQLNIRPVSF